MQIRDLINVLDRLGYTYENPKVYGTATFYHGRHDDNGESVKLRKFKGNGKFFMERVIHDFAYSDRSVIQAIEVTEEQYENTDTFQKSEFVHEEMIRN